MGSKTKIVALAIVAVVVAVALAMAYWGALETFSVRVRWYQAWQLGSVLALSVALVGLVFYHWRKTARFRREAEGRERERAELQRKVSELRSAIEASGRNAARNRRVVAGLPVAVFAVDGNGVFTLSEGKGLEALGLEPEKVVGRSIFETYREAPQVVENIRLALAGKAVGGILEVNGLTFETRYSPLRENGEFSGVLGVATDVTERKEAEDKLRAAEIRYRTLVEQIPAGVYIQEKEHDGAIVYISPRIQDMVGYSAQEYVENPRLWIETTHPEDRERLIAEVARTDHSGEPFRLEYRKLARDGRVFWVRDEAVLVKGAEGTSLYWQGILVDITERKEAEEALKESQRLLATLLSNAPAFLYRCRNEPEWPNEFVSDHAFELTGHTPAELTNGTVMYGDLILEEDRKRVWEEVQAGLAERRRFELQYSIRRKDGRVRHVEERGQGVYDEDGGGVEAIEGVVYDVTERVLAEEALRDAEKRYRTLVEQIPAITYINAADGSDVSLYTSPQIEGMLGYTPEEWRADKLWEQRLHPEDRERILAADERFEAGDEKSFSEEYRLLARDGSVVWVREEAVLIRDEVGEPLYWQGVIFDVTDQKETEEALRKSRAGLAEAQRIAHLGNWEWDPQTGEVYWSDETFRVYGFEPQSFVPTIERLLVVVHPDDRNMLRRSLEEALRGDRTYDLEHRVVRPSGEVRVVRRQAEVVRDEEGKPVRMVGTVHDVTERKALEEQLQHQAMHDPLTGLPNRALFTDRLRQALARAKRRGGEVAVLFMDLDNFKVINDSLGHKAGDRLLVAVSKRIRTLLRPEDTVARLGGDEFIFLLENADLQDAHRVAERVLEALREPFMLGGRRLVVTASIGVAPGGGDNGKYAADVLRDADLAMYRAKRSGKARHAVFEEAMNLEAVERLEMEHNLRRAVERGELTVHYQPQMMLDANLQRYLRATGSGAIVMSRPTRDPSVTGMEALVRWEHPERGLLLPGEFIAVAEETGLIVPIGEWVLVEACSQAKAWQERFAADPPLGVYVNLSAGQFREPNLTETVSRILRETQLDPRCLHLEITETTAMSDALATVLTLEKLKALGVRLVIDDFGTGYSSLSYLQRFPVDYVKIDRSFVGGLEKEPGATALVSGMISLAHALGLGVIAEGVESARQLERLCAMQCDMAQGYYFSGSLPSEEMGALLSSIVLR